MIIGLTGTFGAGKGVVAKFLVSNHNFKHFSARDFIVEEIKNRDLTVNRDTMTAVANDLRDKFGPTYILEQLVNKAEKYGGDAVVESIRAVAEAEYVKKKGGYVLAIDADPKIRFNRIIRRNSETDNVSFEKWCKQEQAESNNSDPAVQNIPGSMAKANKVIVNNKSLSALLFEVEDWLKTLSGDVGGRFLLK